jgi:hypothetical protein
MNKVEEYVRNNYKKLFGDKKLIIEEFESHYEIKTQADQSPLILSKTITK